MTSVYYTAVTRFGPDHGKDSWQKYIEWSGLGHVREVITLDVALCPSIVQGLSNEDWQYVHEESKTCLLRDLDYLLGKLTGTNQQQVNVLAVMKEPTASDVGSFDDSRFVFCGFKD